MTKPSTSEKTTSVDVMSPYYLAPSDQPATSLVVDALNDRNYSDWLNEVTDALYAKNKIGFVDGTIPMPESDAPKYVIWRRCNAMVKAWLNASMSREIKDSVKHGRTAREVWLDLEERFGKESAPRAYELRRALVTTRQEGNSVSGYYSKLRALWDEIQSISSIPECKCGKCTCNLQKQFISIREKEKLYDFLMGLNESFGVIRSQVLGSKPTPSLGEAYRMVSEDERHRHIAGQQAHHAALEAAAFFAPREDEVRGPRRERPKCTF